MKKIISIILFFALVTPFTGTYIWLQYKKNIVKKQVKREIIRGIDKKELVAFRFTKHEIKTKLKWEHSKEFEYRGEMYDVVESSIKNDSVFYLCWHDKEETRLSKLLAQLTYKALDKNPQKKESQSRLIAFYKSLFFLEKFKYCLFENNMLLHEIVYLHSIYKSWTKPPDDPPPRCDFS